MDKLVELLIDLLKPILEPLSPAARRRIGWVLLAIVGLLLVITVVMAILALIAAVQCRRVEVGPIKMGGDCTPRNASSQACPVAGETDAEMLFALIDAEALAVMEEDLARIDAIFVPDATILNEASGQQFASPDAYYTEKFRNEIHCELEHSDYRVESLSATEARVTTASRGKWGWQDEGCTMSYANQPASDEWHFRKDEDGCWRIVRFVFNRS